MSDTTNTLAQQLVTAVMNAFVSERDQQNIPSEVLGWTGDRLDGDARAAVVAVLRELAPLVQDGGIDFLPNFDDLAAEIESRS